MGEYADMLLEGDCCAECGTPFDDAGDGIPRYCDECGREDAQSAIKPAARVKSIPCSACTRKFHSAFALAQHRSMKGH